MKGVFLMSTENYSTTLKSNNEKLTLMLALDHPFVIRPAQNIKELNLEYGKSESLHGILILHYLKSNSINVRVCHNHCIQRNFNKFKIVAFNHYRTRHWFYDGELVYQLKFIPMTCPEGTPWPKERQTEFIRYFFDLGDRIKISTDRPAQPEKIARALKGSPTQPSPKDHSRVITWLVRLGLWRS